MCNLAQPASFELLYEAHVMNRVSNDALFYRGFAPPHGVFWRAMYDRVRLWFAPPHSAQTQRRYSYLLFTLTSDSWEAAVAVRAFAAGGQLWASLLFYHPPPDSLSVFTDPNTTITSISQNSATATTHPKKPANIAPTGADVKLHEAVGVEHVPLIIQRILRRQAALF